MTLVIMAAGMGSRFGGLKQIEPVGPNGEFIVDYSIYDAIRCGFTKVVFIIKEENYELFRETVGKRIEDKIKVEYVFQTNENVPKGIEIPKERAKPLGTAHAILCCKDVVKENFAIINADDFYGYDAYKVMSRFIKSNTNPNEYAMAGYIVGNTLTENGAVKRGVCEKEGQFLTRLIESNVGIENNKIIAHPLEEGEPFEINKDTLVSMNMFGFTPDLFEHLETGFKKFLNRSKDNLEKCEYLIPSVVYELIQQQIVKVNVLKTTAVWHGITYKEDKENLVKAIADLISQGEYPEELWK